MSLCSSRGDAGGAQAPRLSLHLNPRRVAPAGVPLPGLGAADSGLFPAPCNSRSVEAAGRWGNLAAERTQTTVTTGSCLGHRHRFRPPQPWPGAGHTALREQEQRSPRLLSSLTLNKQLFIPSPRTKSISLPASSQLRDTTNRSVPPQTHFQLPGRCAARGQHGTLSKATIVRATQTGTELPRSKGAGQPAPVCCSETRS